MCFFKRSLLYLWRKKGRTFLLFFILLVIATFTLIAISIKRASTNLSQNVRKELGAKFNLEVVLEQSNPYFRLEEKGPGMVIFSVDKAIDQEMINQIMEIKGIKYYSANTEIAPYVKNINLLSGTMDTDAQFKDVTQAFVVANTKFDEHFLSKELQLTDGRHIVEDDKNAIIISRNLLEKNDLKIGDTVSFYFELYPEDILSCEIVGIFEPENQEGKTDLVPTANKKDNLLFIDFNTLKEHPTGQGFYKSEFYVEDPEAMDDIVKEVNKIKTIDWKAFKLNISDESYKKSEESLNATNSLALKLLIIIILVSCIILSLVLTIIMKGRVHETGILMSLGISKSKIFFQYLTEVLIIATIAFSLSYELFIRFHIFR